MVRSVSGIPFICDAWRNLLNNLKKKSVVVTGCCGTVGKELVTQLLQDFSVGELIGLDNNESEIFFLEERWRDLGNASFYMGDVRDRDVLVQKFRGIDFVFHTAAYKHVILCERSPMEAVQTNILGVQNVIYAAHENGVEKVIFTSSDKAVNPTNVMGTSKLMGERLMTAANSNSRDGKTVYSSTRFGNVLGSSGSVIPIFKQQIEKGGPVTLTDPGMTRFIMSIKEAVRLVINSSFLACGGEVFVTKMPVMRIQDLANVMINRFAPDYGFDPQKVETEIIGVKPGEKLYEELLSEEETRRTLELENYFAILPAFKNVYRNISYDFKNIKSREIDRAYNSKNESAMSCADILTYLKLNDLLNC